MESEDGSQASSPVELQYLTLLCNGKLPSVLSMISDRLMTSEALRVGCISNSAPKESLVEGWLSSNCSSVRYWNYQDGCY